MEAAERAVREVCGDGRVTCRFTHVYPDGPAPYFTVLAPARRGAELEQWDEIKAAASDAVIAGGGTITHHHAVGRDHRPWYDRQRPDRFADALRAAKAALDPAAILNPGVLMDPLQPRLPPGALESSAMSILREPGERDELHRLRANEIYVPRKDTREEVQTIGRGALACPSCDVPIVAAGADPRSAPSCAARSAGASTPRAASCASTERHAAQRRAGHRAARASDATRSHR